MDTLAIIKEIVTTTAAVIAIVVAVRKELRESRSTKDEPPPEL